jgi:hypothetical protein
VSNEPVSRVSAPPAAAPNVATAARIGMSRFVVRLGRNVVGRLHVWIRTSCTSPGAQMAATSEAPAGAAPKRAQRPANEANESRISVRKRRVTSYRAVARA